MSRPGQSEIELLLACLRPQTGNGEANGIRAAAAGMGDWPSFEGLAQRHRVSGLVAERLRGAGIAPSDTLKAAERTGIMANLRLTAAAIRLSDRLAQEDIPAAIIKGPPLAQLAFGSPTTRHSKDLDVLVARADVSRTWRVMEEEGYRQLLPATDLEGAPLALFLRRSKDSVHRNRTHGIEVELHWVLHDVMPTELAAVASNFQQVRVGADATLTTLGPLDLFDYLCVHGACHGWSRLKWLVDIAELLAAAPDGGAGYWQALRDGGSADAVLSAMRLSHRLLGVALPNIVPQRAPWRVRVLDRLTIRAIAAGGGSERLTGSRWILAHFAPALLTPTWREFGAIVWRQLVAVDDVTELRLQRGGSLSYMLLRLPIWLAKKLAKTPGRGRTAPQRSIGGSGK